MNRRSFMSAIFALGAAPAIVRADSLMRIVVPKPAQLLAFGGMTTTLGGNSLLTIEMITREALRILHAQGAFVGAINDEYAVRGLNRSIEQWAAMGDTVTVRVPRKYV